MTLDGQITTTLWEVQFTEVVRTDDVLRTLDGGYCFTFYDDKGEEAYIEMSADCARLLRDKLLAVVDDEELYMEEFGDIVDARGMPETGERR